MSDSWTPNKYSNVDADSESSTAALCFLVVVFARLFSHAKAQLNTGAAELKRALDGVTDVSCCTDCGSRSASDSAAVMEVK